MIITTHEAIQSLRPGKGFYMQGDDRETVVWDDNSVTTPTQQEIEAAFGALQAKKIADELSKEQTRQVILEKLGLSAEELALVIS